MTNNEFKDGIVDQPLHYAPMQTASADSLKTELDRSILKDKVIKKISFATMITANKRNLTKLYKYLGDYEYEYVKNITINTTTRNIDGAERLAFELYFHSNTSTKSDKVLNELHGFIWFIAGLFHHRHIPNTSAWKGSRF